MREMIGCAGMIAAVAFVIGVIGSLFASEANIGERLMMASITAALAFVAALILLARDYKRHTSTMRSVRQTLLARQDVHDRDFLAHFPGLDATLIAQTRQAIAQFFDVPAAKIHPTDHLRNDLRFETFEPNFHAFVVYHVLDARNVQPQMFSFNPGSLTDVASLATGIQRVLDEFETSKPSNYV